MDRCSYILEKLFYSNVDKYGTLRLYKVRPGYSDRDVYLALEKYLENSNSRFVMNGYILGGFKEKEVGNLKQSTAPMSELVRGCQYLFYTGKGFNHSLVKSFEYTTPLVDEDLRPYMETFSALNTKENVRNTLYPNNKALLFTTTFKELVLLLVYGFKHENEMMAWAIENSKEKVVHQFYKVISSMFLFKGSNQEILERKPLFNISEDYKYNQFLVKFANCKRNPNGVPIMDINKNDSNYDKILVKILSVEKLFVIGNYLVSDIFSHIKVNKDLQELKIIIDIIKNFDFEEYNTPYILLNEFKYLINVYSIYSKNTEVYRKLYGDKEFHELLCYKYIERRLYESFDSLPEFYLYLENINTKEAEEVYEFTKLFFKEYGFVDGEMPGEVQSNIKPSNTFGG